MTELDHETFDIRDVLTGRTFPEDEVTVHLDAKADFEIHRLNQEASVLRLTRKTDEARALEAAVEALIKQASGTAIKVTVRAIPNELRETIMDEVLEKYPEERNIMGQVEPVKERDLLWTNRRWQAHIVSLETPKGTDNDISLEKIVALRASVPEYGLQKIADTIDGLYHGAKGGFEQAAQETAFSSAASREA